MSTTAKTPRPERRRRYAAEKRDQGPDWYVVDRETGQPVGDARSQHEAREKAREMNSR